MNKNKSVRFAACVAFALAASATLPAAELAHRWSFNGDYSDSAGGMSRRAYWRLKGEHIR